MNYVDELCALGMAPALANLIKNVPTAVGRATLSGGTVTVSTARIKTLSEVQLSNRQVSGTPGTLSVGTVSSGVSFVINSSSGSDNSVVSWAIFEDA